MSVKCFEGEQSRISAALLAFQPVFAAIDPLDLELLPRLDTVLPPDFSGQNDLSLT